jgi:hypothetical protein
MFGVEKQRGITKSYGKNSSKNSLMEENDHFLNRKMVDAKQKCSPFYANS